jgi:IMP dehydrogenase
VSKIFYNSLGKTLKWPRLINASPSSLTYDDVLLVPQSSNITSRENVTTKIKFGPYELTKPIISAPMDTISGEKMIRRLADLGAIGTLPRGDLSQRINLCKTFTTENIPCLYAIGLKNGFEEAKELKKAGAKMILVDVAHGGMFQVRQLAKEIKTKLKLTIVAGNIVTYTQAQEYVKDSVDIARVGVGPGGLCITRLVAGSGFPQLSAIFETTSAGIPVIADGGIKKPADFAKAIAAGASIVMIGSLFAGCDETPGEVVGGFKTARGQASKDYMKDAGVSTGEFRAAEGISIRVPTKGPAEHVINDLMGGLRSAMTYAGAENIKEFQKKAIFSIISGGTNDENKPWLAD